MRFLSCLEAGLMLAVSVAGCSRDADKEKGAAPPPVQSSKPGVCSSGGGKIADPVAAAHVPRQAGDYCADPNGETRSYGEDAAGTVGEVCTQLFDGECEVYKAHGLQRVVTVRYVDGKGSPGAVNLNLSRFDSRQGAYGFFTRRVIASSDPADARLTELKAGGQAAMGSGMAYVWRGKHVAELSYTNELESPEQLRASGKRALPPLASALGAKLPGDRAHLREVQALPTAERFPLGVSYVTDDVLGIAGVGPGPVGFYKAGERRFRVFALARQDEDAAGDVMKTLGKVDNVKRIKSPPLDALVLSRRASDEGPKIEWVVTRSGAYVFGLGDEEYALLGAPEAEHSKRTLSQSEKITRLKAIAAAAGAVSR